MMLLDESYQWLRDSDNMPYETVNPNGVSRSRTPQAGGSNPQMVPVFAIVKDNIDSIRTGRIQVYIADFSGPNPDQRKSWVPVSFLSPFFGNTQGVAVNDPGDKKLGDNMKNPVSYGMWFSPPDIGSTVICIFVNGDPNYGFYIGGIPSPEALHMVPAIGAVDNIITQNQAEADSYGGATRLPVTNINHSSAGGSDFLDKTKPVHSYTAGILNQQGLIRDPIRGTIGTSAQRESPSRVGFGILTPGRPILEGGYTDETLETSLNTATVDQLQLASRRSGHSFVMDDGDIVGRDQLIRLRTSMGHQILMSDDGQCLHIIHSNGQSWIELGKEGTIDMYAMNSLNVRTQGDLNFHADRNINIHAKKTLNINAESINVNSEKDTNFRTGTNFSGYTMGKYTIKVDGAMSHASSGEASYASTNITYINGSNVNLNTGSTSTIPATVQAIQIQKHSDTLYDSTKGFAAAPNKLESIVSRAPAHAPWDKAGYGVDVKIDLGSAANLPSAPSADVASVVTKAADSSPLTAAQAVTPAAVASVTPSGSPLSKAIDASTGAAVVAQATSLAKSAAPNIPGMTQALADGVGVVKDATGKGVAIIGSMALPPNMLADVGVLKCGAAELVNKLAASAQIAVGPAQIAAAAAAQAIPYCRPSDVAAAQAAAVNFTMDPQKALPSGLFTGTPGAENLLAISTNPLAQNNVVSQALQKTQSALTIAGVITGKESSTQISGLLMGGAFAGVAQAVKVVQGSAGTGAITGSISTLISGGGLAANLAATASNRLGSLSAALSIKDGIPSLNVQAGGVAASAFSQILAAFKPLSVGVPQSLKALMTSNLPADPTAGIGKTFVAGIPSGVNAIPGGLAAITSLVVNKGPVQSIINSIPGVDKITNLLTPGGNILGQPNLANINLADVAANGLRSLAATGLPAAQAAIFGATLGGMVAGGGSVKLTTSATNTFDRGAITAQLGAVFGDSRIPVPNFSGNPASVGATAGTAEVDRYNAAKADIEATQDALLEQNKAVRNAQAAYQTATFTLPAGDPGIASAKAAYTAALAKANSIEASLDAKRRAP